MSNADILKKAIDKAQENGFEMNNHKHFCEIGRDNFTGEIKQLGAYQSIIFDHDFAKAFWGDSTIWYCPSHDMELVDGLVTYEEKCADCGSKVKALLVWQMHLQQMVLEKDPIKYLEQFI